jgi:HlyD family secretion protein
MKTLLSLALVTALLAGCSSNDADVDATGTFEAVETVISAEAAGRIDSFAVEEGQRLTAGQVLGTIDTVQLSLRRKQLIAQIDAVLSRRPQVAVQLAALRQQVTAATRERDRIRALVAADAATPKQLDDATTALEVATAQLEALRSTLGTTTEGLEQDTRPLREQLAQIDDQLAKARIVSPLNGTVLTKYAERYEVTAPGRPLFAMADLSTMILRMYVTGADHSTLRIGQRVTVFVDKGASDRAPHDGTITWISPKAEFTPKTIQTKDERAHLVYAVKVAVPNDGTLKIGMYGEVRF